MARMDFMLQAYKAKLITADEIRALAQAALAKITAGAGEVKQLAGWGMAGKNFTFLSDMTASDLLEACTFALTRIDGSSPDFIYPRFTSQ
jgi:hypothetical protein